MKRQPISRYHQQGFLLPLALFILIVGGALLALMLRQTTFTHESTLVSGLFRQSVDAADTGAQLGVNQILFPYTSRQQSDERCSQLALDQVFNVPGLQQCTLQVSCVCRYENNTLCDATNSSYYNGTAGFNESYYRVESIAMCGVEPYQGRSSRVIYQQFP